MKLFGKKKGQGQDGQGEDGLPADAQNAFEGGLDNDLGGESLDIGEADAGFDDTQAIPFDEASEPLAAPPRTVKSGGGRKGALAGILGLVVVALGGGYYFLVPSEEPYVASVSQDPMPAPVAPAPDTTAMPTAIADTAAGAVVPPAAPEASVGMADPLAPNTISAMPAAIPAEGITMPQSDMSAATPQDPLAAPVAPADPLAVSPPQDDVLATAPPMPGEPALQDPLAAAPQDPLAAAPQDPLAAVPQDPLAAVPQGSLVTDPQDLTAAPVTEEADAVPPAEAALGAPPADDPADVPAIDSPQTQAAAPVTDDPLAIDAPSPDVLAQDPVGVVAPAVPAVAETKPTEQVPVAPEVAEDLPVPSETIGLPADTVAVTDAKPAENAKTGASAGELAIVNNAGALDQLPPPEGGVVGGGMNTVAANDAISALASEDAMIRPLPKQYLVVQKDHKAGEIDTRLTAARLALTQGRTQAALQIFNELYADYPRDKRVMMGRAVSFQKLGQTGAALSAYEDLLNRDPKNLEALTNMLGLLKKENPGLAVEKLLELREAYPFNADITAQLGVAYAGSGEYEEALKYLEMADALKPGSAFVLYNKGVLFDKMGRSAEAAAIYRQIVRLSADGYLDQSLNVDAIKRRLAVMR